MTKCVMCQKEFEKKDLDFLGRCDSCFKKYLDMKPGDKPFIGVPWMPGYDSLWGKK